MSDAKTREAICTLGASIFDRGLTAGSSGNISVRIDGGWLMTPTNASLGRLDPARLSKLDKATLKDLLNARLLQIESKTKKKRAAPAAKKPPVKRAAKKKKKS